MDFSIHMGIPEMLELWMRLHKESMDGSISKADAKWTGLLEIANSSAKSAAINKAKSLVKALGIG